VGSLGSLHFIQFMPRSLCKVSIEGTSGHPLGLVTALVTGASGRFESFFAAPLSPNCLIARIESIFAEGRGKDGSKLFLLRLSKDSKGRFEPFFFAKDTKGLSNLFFDVIHLNS